MRKKPEVPGTIGTIVLLIGFKIVIVGHFSAAKSAKSAKISFSGKLLKKISRLSDYCTDNLHF